MARRSYPLTNIIGSNVLFDVFRYSRLVVVSRDKLLRFIYAKVSGYRVIVVA